MNTGFARKNTFLNKIIIIVILFPLDFGNKLSSKLALCYSDFFLYSGSFFGDVCFESQSFGLIFRTKGGGGTLFSHKNAPKNTVQGVVC